MKCVSAYNLEPDCKVQSGIYIHEIPLIYLLWEPDVGIKDELIDVLVILDMSYMYNEFL